MMQFLPVTMKEMQNRGISQPDFVYVCGDAYVDHPSFGWQLLQDFWNIMDTAWELLHSRTGRKKKVSAYLENQGWDF